MNGQLCESPIEVLFHAFEGAPSNLAPERSDELGEIIRQHNIQFKLDEETHVMRFEGADLFGGLGLVCVGLRGLERLWAHAYGIVHIYFRFQAVGFTREIHLRETQEGVLTEQLLDWALRGEHDGDPTPWPVGLPKPQGNPTDDQNRVTNELFLGAMGFAVLHEIGHIVRGHGGTNLPKDVKYRHEFEADEWAYDWVMDRWRDYAPDNPVVFKKRCTLIACLFSLIAINHVRAPRNIEQSGHPHSIDRLMRFLLKHANESAGLPASFAWAVPTTAIHLHLSQVLDQPLAVKESFPEYFAEIRRRFPGL